LSQVKLSVPCAGVLPDLQKDGDDVLIGKTLLSPSD